MPKIILNGTTYAAGLDQKTFDKIGTDTLDTDAQDLSGAVNELNSSLSQLKTLREVGNDTVTLYTDTSYTDYTYTFTGTYSEPPSIVVNVFTGTGTQANVPVVAVTNITTTQASVRVWKQYGVQNTSQHTAMANPVIYIAVFA